MERLLAHDGVLWLMAAVLTTGRHEGLASTVGKVFAEADEGLVIRSRKEYQRKGGVGRVGEGEHQLCIIDNVSFTSLFVINTHSNPVFELSVLVP